MNLTHESYATDRKAKLAIALLLSKMGEGRVKNWPAKNGSKECAGNTCTPCKGRCPVDPASFALCRSARPL